MALTPAERMKRYRERLKQNPEKLEKIKKKHAEYVKSKTKTVKELPEKEKEKLRKIWRNQKRKQKQKKKQQVQEENLNQDAKLKKQKTKKQSKLLKNYRTALKKNKKMTKLVHTYRKRLYRLRKSTDKQIQKLQEDNLKLTARNEILELAIKTSYKESKTLNQKQTLKNILLNEDVQKTIKKTYVSKLLGLKGLARIRRKNTTENKIRKEIETFYLRDDVSRMTAGKKQCRTSEKKKEQIRYIIDTVQNLFRMYREVGGKYSLSTFYKYKPFYVLSPTVQNRETCLCIKHNNVELLFYAIKKYKILKNFNTVLDVIKSLCCDINSKHCMYEECGECKDNKINYEAMEEMKEDQVQWSQWAVVNHKYTENKTAKEMTTKKTVKLQKEGKISDLVSAFNNSLKLFKRHHFNYIYQQKQYQDCIQNLKPHEALIICDFSENYTCKLGEEVQAKHFGASKNQITLHTGMIYWTEKSQSFCTLSDNNCHEPAAIWAHLLPIINEVKKIDPMTTVIHFHSDGPTSQYRQKKNFYLQNLFTQKLKLDYSTWSFSEAGHGKGVADGIGGTVKRALDRQVAFGRDVDNGSQAYEHLSKCMKLVKIIYIPDNDIKNVQKIVPTNLTTIVGTMKIHQLSSCLPNRIQYRDLSCFCGINRGLCKCFDPKTHEFNKQSAQEVINSDPVVFNISDSAMTDEQYESLEVRNNGRSQKLVPKIEKKANLDLIEVMIDSETANTQKTSLDCSMKLKKNLCPKSPEKNNSGFEVTTVMADVHVDSGKPEFNLPIIFENGNILDLKIFNDTEGIIGENNNPANSKPEDSVLIDLILNEDEKKRINEAFDVPYLDAEDGTSGTDKISGQLIDDSATSKTNKKSHSPVGGFIGSIPDLMDQTAKNNITTLAKTHYAAAETEKTKNKRVSTLECFSPQKKVKVEIIGNNILSKIKPIIKDKTEQKPSKTNKKSHSPTGGFIGSIPDQMDQTAKNNITTLAKTDYAVAETEKTKIKRVSTLECFSPQKKVKVEIIENHILPKIKPIIKGKTEQKPSKALKAVVSRTLPCNKCKMLYLFYSSMTKCFKCEKFYCKKCILSSREENDIYICDLCVEL